MAVPGAECAGPLETPTQLQLLVLLSPGSTRRQARKGPRRIEPAERESRRAPKGETCTQRMAKGMHRWRTHAGGPREPK